MYFNRIKVFWDLDISYGKDENRYKKICKKSILILILRKLNFKSMTEKYGH